MIRVINGDLNAELHPLLLQVHIQTSDLCIGDPGLHSLGSDSAVERVTINEDRLRPTLSVCLEQIHSLDGIFNIAPLVCSLHQEHSIHHHVRKETRVSPNDLARHRCLSNTKQAFLAQSLDFCGDVLVHVFDSFSESKPVAVDDGRRVYPVLHQFIRSS